MKVRNKINERKAFMRISRADQKAKEMGKTTSKKREKKNKSGGKKESLDTRNDCKVSFVMTYWSILVYI